MLAQTIREIEIILEDDGSTDGTAAEVKPYGDRIRYVYQEKCGGSAARNRGIELAEGEWIAYLDSEDQFLPTIVDSLLTGVRASPDDGAKKRRSGMGEILGTDCELGLIDGFFETLCRNFNFFWTSALLVKKSLLSPATPR